MDEPRRITVRDPSRPAPAPLDELDAEQPRSRRGLVVVLVVLAVLAALRVGDTVLDRRAAAAEERRLAAVVELGLTTRFTGGSSTREPGDLATVSVNVGVRNTGPRAVELLSAAYGPFRFAGTRTVDAGDDAPVPLSVELDCRTRPAQVDVGPAVVVSVRTSGGEVVERRLPVPADLVLTDPEQLRRGCGYLDLSEAGSAFVDSTTLRDDVLEVRLVLLNRGRAPVSFGAVTGGAGMTVRLVDDAGVPVPLPLVLEPARDGLEEERFVVARLSVADCAALQPDTNAFDGLAPSSLATTFRDQDGVEATGVSELEGDVAERLVRTSCG